MKNKWPVHATWAPHRDDWLWFHRQGDPAAEPAPIACDKAKITVMIIPRRGAILVEKGGRCLSQARSYEAKYKAILTPLLTAGPGQALIVNLTVDVGSIDIIKLARETNSLCIDTVNEPWPGFYYNTKLANADRTNYKVREDLLEVRRKLGVGPTAVSCCGANPGMCRGS